MRASSKFCAALLLSVGAFVANAQDRPSTWREWLASKTPGDKEITSRILKADWWDNCIAWGVGSRQKAKSRRFSAVQAYLINQSLVNGKDIGGVNGKIPEIGMTTCGAYAILGRPQAVNHTESRGGHRTQIVFRNRGVYVYTQSSNGDGNALISSLQY